MCREFLEDLKRIVKWKIYYNWLVISNLSYFVFLVYQLFLQRLFNFSPKKFIFFSFCILISFFTYALALTYSLFDLYLLYNIHTLANDKNINIGFKLKIYQSKNNGRKKKNYFHKECNSRKKRPLAAKGSENQNNFTDGFFL